MARSGGSFSTGSSSSTRECKELPTSLASEHTLANSKIRLDSVKRMTKIQNTS